MRTPKEILEEFGLIPSFMLICAIEYAQTEAWNEALEAAIRHLEKVTTRGDILYIVSKLKK